MTALGFYTRLRLTQNLLPLLSCASNNGELSRVINIAGGTKEGIIYPDDFQALKVSLLSLRGHLTSMITLTHFALAQQFPEATFIQIFPGSVKTALMENIPGILGKAMRLFATVGTATGLAGWISIEECAQRCTFTSTSAIYPPAQSKDDNGGGVLLLEGLQLALGADGKIGTGVYSIDWNGTVINKKAIDLVRQYREDGTMEKLMKHASDEFERISGTA
jgi:hypothetical protein